MGTNVLWTEGDCAFKVHFNVALLRIDDICLSMEPWRWLSVNCESETTATESPMTGDKKNFDEMPERRSDRSIPLNVETVLVEGARKSKQFNPDEENEKLKKDDTDLDTIRGDLETPEPIPQKKRK
jgi:hypothetical protein